jgi:hypothetical protein
MAPFGHRSWNFVHCGVHRFRRVSLLEVVPEAGVEPARGVTARDFESRMTANSITPALA